MVDGITVTGMVLRATPVGEYDKRLVLLTKERGKITAFAKGARRPKSSLQAGSRPFSFGEFTVYPGKNAYNLMSVNIQNYFDELTRDFDAVCFGYYFLEFAEYYGVENVDASEMLNLLYASFRALRNENIPNALVRRIFELKLLTINGEYPEFFQCTLCGNEDGASLQWYSEERTGMVCDKCKEKAGVLKRLNTSTLYTCQFIISKKISELYTFQVSEQVQRELGNLLDKQLRMHVDAKFHSLSLLDANI